MQVKINFKKILLFIIAILLFGMFFISINSSLWPGSSVRNNQGTQGYRENPWVLKKEGKVINANVELPEYLKLETGKLYSISTTMTYDGTKDNKPYGFIHLDHLYCRVLLDDEVLFSFMPEDFKGKESSKSPGFIYKSFELPKDCKGKTIEIELMPLLTTSLEYGLPDIEFGDLVTTVDYYFHRDLGQNIVTVISIILGFLSIIFATFYLTGSDYREGLSIGIFSLLFSLYLITETEFNFYYIGKPYYLYLLNYTVFSLLPISLMGFMRERLLENQRKICSFIIAFELIFVAIEIICHFNRILDIREFITYVHMIYFVELFLIIIFISKMKDKKKRKSLVLQLLPVMIGMVLDGFIYWLHLDIGSNDATFTILGVIVFMIVELIHVWRTSISIYTESVRSSTYRQMAYIDELTGLGNRRYYDNVIDEILTNKKRYDSLFVVSLDLNELKYVNDNFGHAAGDKLIKSAAVTMLNAVGDKGQVFRTGGDEFTIFLYNISQNDLDEIIAKGKMESDLFTKENEYSMSLAVGYVQIFNNNIIEAVKEADHNMYVDKIRTKLAK